MSLLEVAPVRRSLQVCLLFALLLPASGWAHEFAPGLLRVQAQSSETWQVVWRAPTASGASGAPSMPEACDPSTLASGTSWRLQCPQEALQFDFSGAGLAGADEILVSFTPAPGAEPSVARVRPGGTWRAAPTAAASAEGGAAALTWPAYLGLGFEHILFGFDHLAFVFGLLFLVSGLRRIVGTLTAFTVAHSLTLAAAVLGWVEVPSAPVEAIIALSVVFVARAAVSGREEAAPAFTFAFVFGLLHGLGFAGALSAIGLPVGQVPAALLTFNLGVELGQLAVVAAALLLVAGARRAAPALTAAVRTPAVYGLGVLAAVWTLERVAMVGGWR